MDNSKFRWCGNVLIGVGMALVVWAVGVSVWPKSYRACFLVRVDKDVDKDARGFHNEDSRDFDRYWISFQVEEMQSKPFFIK